MTDPAFIAALTAKGVVSAEHAAVVRRDEAEFGLLDDLAATVPITPNLPRGWPQVALGRESLDNWTLLSPAIGELRRLCDYTVGTPRTSAVSECGNDVGGGR